MEFLFAKITNSRLMGSMGLRISWRHEGTTLNQYFLLDAEGLGLSDYLGICDGEEKDLFMEEERLMGGLGADRISIPEDEAVFIVKEYASKNISYGKPLPSGREEYSFILEMDRPKIEREELFFKLCKEQESELEFVNYMAMRFIARDREALGFYSINSEIKNMHITHANGTLLKSSVKELKNGNYLCSLLYEDMGEYFKTSIGISIGIEKGRYRLRSIKVGRVQKVDCMDALEEIKREEYLGIYLIKDVERFEYEFTREMSHCLKSPFEKGTMLTEFKPENMHVGMKEYFISNDINAIFFISKAGQLVVSNYEMDQRISVDSMLLSKYREYLSLNDEFIFSGSLIYDFAQDKTENFYEFISRR